MCHSFHFITRHKNRVEVKKRGERERERTALSALANANFLFPARLQWDTPRLLLFRQSTTLSLNSAIIIESLSLSYFLTLISILTLFSLSRKLFRDKKERASYTTYSATLFENREVHAKEEEEEGGYAHNAAKKEDNA